MTILLGLLLALQAPSSVYADDEAVPTVVVLPFAANIGVEYAYLGKAVDQMLLTRLSRFPEMKVSAVDLDEAQRGPLRDQLRRGDPAALARFNGDWLVAPAMDSIQERVELKVRLVPLTGGDPVDFAENAASQEQVIGALNALAGAIHRTVVKKAAAAPEPAAEGGTGAGLGGFATPHPERAYKRGLYGGTPLISGDQGPAMFESRGVRKSGPLPLAVESMAVADLNGDGVSDLVVSSRSKIRVYTFADLKFQEVAQYDFSPRLKIHAINIGDPEGSGTSKLYVSANEGKFASSAVLAWNGSASLQSVRQGLRWYIRPTRIPGRGEVLLGQQASPREEDRYLSPGVFELGFDPANGQLVRGPELLLPEGVNLFDFAQADLDGDREIETMVIDARQKLLVYDSAFNQIWVSGANYGGSSKYLGPAWDSGQIGNDAGQMSEAEQSNRQLVFVPGRLEAKDINSDGRPEVIVSSNDLGVSAYLPNTRYYDGGSVACLAWYGQGLAELWRTNQIDGQVSDYSFDDSAAADEAGGAEVLNRLYVAQIPPTPFWEKVLPSGATSKILAYEMVVARDAGGGPRQ